MADENDLQLEDEEGFDDELLDDDELELMEEEEEYEEEVEEEEEVEYEEYEEEEEEVEEVEIEEEEAISEELVEEAVVETAVADPEPEPAPVVEPAVVEDPAPVVASPEPVPEAAPQQVEEVPVAAEVAATAALALEGVDGLAAAAPEAAGPEADEKILKLYGWESCWGITDVSPFCLRVSTFMRYSEIPYKRICLVDPEGVPQIQINGGYPKSATGKMPFMRDEDLEICDSSLIIQYLKENYDGDTLDSWLTPEQSAIASFVDTTLCESLYWSAIVKPRFVDDDGWAMTKEALMKGKGMLGQWNARKLFKTQYGKWAESNFGSNLSKETVEDLAISELNKISDFLGDKPYLFGTKPCSADATLFAFMDNIQKQPMTDPVTLHCKGLSNFKKTCERVNADVFAGNPDEIFMGDDSDMPVTLMDSAADGLNQAGDAAGKAGVAVAGAGAKVAGAGLMAGAVGTAAVVGKTGYLLKAIVDMGIGVGKATKDGAVGVGNATVNGGKGVWEALVDPDKVFPPVPDIQIDTKSLKK